MENNTKATSSQVMELKDLISAPLIATIEADSISSRSYLDYLFEIAFESYDKKTGKVGNLRYLTFTYKSCDASVERLQKISIPLLTLVPLPLLQVQQADFDFDIQIVDAVHRSSSEQFSITEAQSITPDSNSEASGIKLRASLAPTSRTSRSGNDNKRELTANMKVHVKMRQADMPGGLSNLLHLTTNNIITQDSEDPMTEVE